MTLDVPDFFFLIKNIKGSLNMSVKAHGQGATFCSIIFLPLTTESESYVSQEVTELLRIDNLVVWM